ncbi:MAG: hypothetical protein LZF62_380057 [Nitrospira sp.]|nr:MAG: hypothetical protein LZF62_380057 [Nitrospira sp.]
MLVEEGSCVRRDRWLPNGYWGLEGIGRSEEKLKAAGGPQRRPVIEPTARRMSWFKPGV